jgi:hypothetical protein
VSAILETTVKNHGVEYPQQNPAVRAKTDATSLKKYGKLRAFLLPEVFEKIRKTHKANYGVEFPLQAKEIQDKISLTFMRTLGATRPFLSETFLERMKEKYGHEWFSCTKAFKEIMLEKYDSEHYVTSDHCKFLRGGRRLNTGGQEPTRVYFEGGGVNQAREGKRR